MELRNLKTMLCTPQEQEMVKREVEPAADKGIDMLVYELPQGG